MIRQVSLLLGLAIFFSWLLPISDWLTAANRIEHFLIPSGARYPDYVSRPLASMMLYVVPVYLLLRDAKTWTRIPESGVWTPALGVAALFYVLMVLGLIHFPLGELLVKVSLLILLVGALTSLRSLELPTASTSEVS